MKKFDLLEYSDTPCQKHETDIYELTHSDVFLEHEVGSEDSTFSEVVKFFHHPKTGKIMPKFCTLKVKNYLDDESFTYVG